MILVIDKSQRDARIASDILYNMGLLSQAVIPQKAHSEISNRYRAIIITSPEALGDIEEYVSMLRKFSLGAPIFALYGDEDKFNLMKSSSHPFDKIFCGAEISYDLIVDIIRYQKSRGLKTIGNYKILGLDVSVFTKRTSFFDIPITFTKTETMIIRFLTVTYPVPAKAADILKFAFKSTKCPEISNIRTHISAINKKISEYLDRPFISSENKLGYTVSTPPELKFDEKAAEAIQS